MNTTPAGGTPGDQAGVIAITGIGRVVFRWYPTRDAHGRAAHATGAA